MKNFILGILLVASVALGGLLVRMQNKVSLAEANATSLRKQVEDLQAGMAAEEARTALVREKLERSVAESGANAAQAAQLSLALTNRMLAAELPQTNSKPANMFSEMFKSPEMREMIKKQQQVALSSVVDKNYADFFKSMQLSPEQSSALKELIIKKMAVGTDVGMEMMSGELTPEQRKELTDRMKKETDAVGAEIKEYLGADNYALLESYEKSLPDRMAVSGFKDQLGGGELALNDAQEQQLIQALSQEREGFKFTTDFGNKETMSGDVFSQFTEDKLNVYFQEQDQLNQRYLARAQTILTPEQYAAYQKSIANQQEMARMGMKMAAQMFNSGKGAK